TYTASSSSPIGSPVSGYFAPSRSRYSVPSEACTIRPGAGCAPTAPLASNSASSATTIPFHSFTTSTSPENFAPSDDQQIASDDHLAREVFPRPCLPHLVRYGRVVGWCEV